MRAAIARGTSRTPCPSCGSAAFTYLPPYSPELNAVERVFRTIKHHELPERTYPTLTKLTAAVEAAFARQETKLLAQCHIQLGLAA